MDQVPTAESPPKLRTDPAGFVNPHTRANKFGRIAWVVVSAILFRPTPSRLARPWRNWLLRRFGAKIGRAYIHPTVEIWAPWKLEIGDDVFVDRDTILYNAFGISIGSRITISRGVFLCTASHDYTLTRFPLIGGPIVVGDDAWIAAEAFVAPGISIGNGAVVGARAVVIKNVEAWTVVGGNPAKLLKARVLREGP